MRVNLQCAGRLTRIGQKEQVNWHLLKIMDSYHDNTERLGIVKWGPQLSAEMFLPDWIEDELREVLVFETIKTFFCTEFNRYSWVVLRDLFGLEFEYHDKRARRLGHLFSIIAKIILKCNPNDKDFWTENTQFLLLACLKLVNGNQDLDEWHTLLQEPTDALATRFMPLFSDAFVSVKLKLEKDPDMKADQKKLRRMVDNRKKQKPCDAIKTETEIDDGEDETGTDEEDQADTYDGLKDHELVQPDLGPRASKSQGKKRARAPATEEVGESSKRARQN